MYIQRHRGISIDALCSIVSKFARTHIIQSIAYIHSALGIYEIHGNRTHRSGSPCLRYGKRDRVTTVVNDADGRVGKVELTLVDDVGNAIVGR